MRPKALIVSVALLTVAWQAASADGWIFTKGRFPKGKVTVFKLTETQKAFIDFIRRCHTNNALTPYVFTLTPDQSAVLRRKAGFRPGRFAIFESFRGDTGMI